LSPLPKRTTNRQTEFGTLLIEVVMKLNNIIVEMMQEQQTGLKSWMKQHADDLQNVYTYLFLHQVMLYFCSLVITAEILIYLVCDCEEARAWIIHNLLEKDGLFMLSEEETRTICKLTEGTFYCCC
jgi:hypothetical protein